MSHFRPRSFSSDSDDSRDSRDSRNSRASGEYEGMAGNDQTSPGRAYAQRAWDEGPLTFVNMRTPGRSSSHQTSPAGESVSPGRPPSQQGEYSSNESGEDDYGRDEDEGDDDELLYSQQLEGMPEHTLPSNPPYAPQPVPSAPPIHVSGHDVTSTRPSESGHSAEALAPGMSQGEGQAGFEPHYLMDQYEPHIADFDKQYEGIYFGDSPFMHPSQDPSPSGGTPLPLRPAGGSSSERSAESISPRSRPNVSPHHLSSAQGSMVAQGSPSPPGSVSDDSSGSGRGSVAAQASPSVQEPAPAPDQYQRGGYSGGRYAGQRLDPHQRGTGHQKRARESSSSSNGSHLQPPRKQHGDQGPRVPQRVSQDQNIDTTLLGISGLEVRGQAQPHGASRPDGNPGTYGRTGASEAEADEIRRAYANQAVPAPRLPNLFAGMPQGASSAYASGAGRGYDRPSQGESSAQGAGRSQPYPGPPGGPSAPQYRPMQGAGPGAASSWTGGTWRGNPPQAQSQGESSGQGAGRLPPEQRGEPGDPFINTFGPSVGVPQPQPQQGLRFEPQYGQPRPDWGHMQGMDAGGIWRYISGQGEDNEGVNWDGRLYRAVDTTKQGHLWSSHQVAQLRVILASYLSWDEVVDQGQPLPGQRNYEACSSKARDLVWTRDHDAEVSRLSSPRLEDRQAALNRLQGEFGRSKDEIVGRCMLFARSNLRANLGNKPTTGLARLKKRG